MMGAGEARPGATGGMAAGLQQEWKGKIGRLVHRHNEPAKAKAGLQAASTCP